MRIGRLRAPTQATISKFAPFSKITNKAWYFMRIVCWQTILMKYHILFFQKLGKMSQNLTSAAVVTGALRIKRACRYVSSIRNNVYRDEKSLKDAMPPKAQLHAM